MIHPDEQRDRTERIKALSTSTYRDVLIYDEKTGGGIYNGEEIDQKSAGRLRKRGPYVIISEIDEQNDE
ncbi:hypothetical protein RJ53_02025 [Methanocalculus chunghsingensis]|uniref:Uncharacterized protein n=1 Tax=Methanocalculus chunghsingensis TaxID=156457 RepID=A0A8J7W4W4_9EURY|nr:hypothetical protein [Methanocalculus chunghsingensis]MBR1368339.1 hypothetical protein [Methanocalculus chunghsingensis]